MHWSKTNTYVHGQGVIKTNTTVPLIAISMPVFPDPKRLSMLVSRSTYIGRCRQGIVPKLRESEVRPGIERMLPERLCLIPGIIIVEVG